MYYDPLNSKKGKPKNKFYSILPFIIGQLIKIGFILEVLKLALALNRKIVYISGQL